MLKIFLMDQLFMEYLLNIQENMLQENDYMNKEVANEQKQVESFQEDADQNHKKIEDLKKRINLMNKKKQELRNMRAAMGAISCPYCTKFFKSMDYLETHMVRRHISEIKLSKAREDQNNYWKLQAEKEKLEKEKLIMKRQIELENKVGLQTTQIRTVTVDPVQKPNQSTDLSQINRMNDQNMQRQGQGTQYHVEQQESFYANRDQLDREREREREKQGPARSVPANNNNPVQQTPARKTNDSQGVPDKIDSTNQKGQAKNTTPSVVQEQKGDDEDSQMTQMDNKNIAKKDPADTIVKNDSKQDENKSDENAENKNEDDKKEENAVKEPEETEAQRLAREEKEAQQKKQEQINSLKWDIKQKKSEIRNLVTNHGPFPAADQSSSSVNANFWVKYQDFSKELKSIKDSSKFEGKEPHPNEINNIDPIELFSRNKIKREETNKKLDELTKNNQTYDPYSRKFEEINSYKIIQKQSDFYKTRCNLTEQQKNPDDLGNTSKLKIDMQEEIAKASDWKPLVSHFEDQEQVMQNQEVLKTNKNVQGSIFHTLNDYTVTKSNKREDYKMEAAQVQSNEKDIFKSHKQQTNDE